ncbi:MAG: hypothetical protein OXC40_06200 [Proteobacteria bacterium]|nr:hypothetical protein [Pseudomonadota bacterium]
MPTQKQRITFKISLTFLALLFLTCYLLSPTPVLSEVTPPTITPQVTLIKYGQSGLSEFVRSFYSEDLDISVMIPVQHSTLDDVLQSLIVWGEGIDDMVISVASPDDSGELSATHLPPDDLDNLYSLLVHFKGNPLTLEVRTSQTTTESIQGILTGLTGTPECRDQDSHSGCQLVSLLVMGQDNRIYPVASKDILNLTFDPSDAKLTMDALIAQDRHNLHHQVMITLKRDPRFRDKPIHISTAIGTPIWQPSYRGVLSANDNILIEAWATFENYSLEDWHNVSIVLKSYNTRSLQSHLSERSFPQRKHVNSDSRQIPLTITNESWNDSVAAEESQKYSSLTPAIHPADDRHFLGDIRIADMTAEYQLPGQFSLKKGHILSLPFLEGAGFESEILTYYFGRGKNNVGWLPGKKMLAIKNNLAIKLPPGIMTLYDSNVSYMGDLYLPEIHPTEHRLLDFGHDPQIKVTEHEDTEQRKTLISLKQGLVRIQIEDVLRTTYQIKSLYPPENTVNHGLVTDLHQDRGGKTLRIFHPFRQGYSIITDNASEPDDQESNDPQTSPDKKTINFEHQGYTFPVVILGGQTKTLTIVESRPRLTEVKLGHLSRNELQFYLSATTMDPKINGFLQHLMKLTDNASQAKQTLENFTLQQESLKDDQKRIAAILSALSPNHETYQPFSAKLIELESEIQAGEKNKQQLKKQYDKAQFALKDHISKDPQSFDHP